jgi:hypothetical protein
MALTGGYLIVNRGDVIIDRYGDTAALVHDEHDGETLRGTVSVIDPRAYRGCVAFWRERDTDTHGD